MGPGCNVHHRSERATRQFAGRAGVIGLSLYCCSMAVMVEMIHTGCAPDVRAEVGALIEHALSDRPGDWRALISRVASE